MTPRTRNILGIINVLLEFVRNTRTDYRLTQLERRMDEQDKYRADMIKHNRKALREEIFVHNPVNPYKP